MLAPRSQRDRIVSRTGTHSPASRLQWVSPTVWGYRRPPPPGALAGAVALTPEPPRQSLRTCPGGSSGTTFSYLSRAPRSAGAWPWFSVLPCWVHGDRTSCFQPCLHNRGWHQWLRNVLGWANREWNCQTHASRSVVAALDCPTDGCGVFMSGKQTKRYRRHARRANDADITNWTGNVLSASRSDLGFLDPRRAEAGSHRGGRRGIPVVAFNSGINQWRDMGGLEYSVRTRHSPVNPRARPRRRRRQERRLCDPGAGTAQRS